MTYEEIKQRLTNCELKLKELKTPENPARNSNNYNTAIQKLTVLKESLQKQLKEAEKTAFVNGKPVEYEDEKDLEKLKDNSDVKTIKTLDGKNLKEQDGVKFSVEETKAIATKVGKAVAMSLKSLGDEVAHMKAKNIEEGSFEIYVQYKNDADDQFSFYIVDDTLHLVDFSFDKELTDVGVKPSGEPIVNVDVLANELVKHFKSLNETEVSEAPEDKYYIRVAVRDARKALAIIDDSPAYSKAVEMDGSDTYYLTDEELAYDLLMDFGAHDIEVTDNNIELDEASDYARRRAAERDYQPSKRDVPPKKYKEPKNDYFARRKAEMEEGDVDAQVDGGDLDVGHQDDEPDMLMKDIYDIATYAAKLHKMLKKYNDFDGEVDFPQWWQKKIILARDYISAAQHYLEAEEKQPALDQLALEGKEGATEKEEEKFHKNLDTLVHKTFGKGEHEKTMKEDWGGSDQAAMNQSIHKDLGEPTSMPSPFSRELESAAEEAVDFYWDDWEEYETDREGLIEHAKKAYLRAYFKETFNKMVQMFSESENAKEKDIDMNEGRKDNDALFPDNPRLPEIKKLADKIISMVKAEAAKGELGYIKTMEEIRYQQEHDFERTPEWNKAKGIRSDFDDYGNGTNEGIGKTQKAHGLVVAKMKELAKQYKAGDTSVVAQLKDLTAKKKQLEKQLEKDVAGKNRGQQLDTNINEEKSTCCGKCGRKHVKGTKCKTPYLKGKDHCRTK